ncbi:MAG: ADP-ribosylation factor-like protein [Promethearchaeota archaeon]
MPNQFSKILIIGLDNSGKTSIVLSLQKNINLLSYTSLEPTKRFEITELDDLNSKFHIWDFGGQEQYRDDHLENLKTYLTGAKKFIYVIDIQDKKRFDLTLEYFKSIIKILEEEKPSIKLSIFLHKFDPDLIIEADVVQKLIDQIIEILPENFDYRIYKTSIYTIFRKIALI